MRLLQEEDELQEIVSLVGIDALGAKDQFKLEAARSVREDYLQQNAFSDTDSYTSVAKMYKMLRNIILFYETGVEALENGALLSDIMALPVITEIAKSKDIEQDNMAQFDKIVENIRRQVAGTLKSDAE